VASFCYNRCGFSSPPNQQEEFRRDNDSPSADAQADCATRRELGTPRVCWVPRCGSGRLFRPLQARNVAVLLNVTWAVVERPILQGSKIGRFQ